MKSKEVTMNTTLTDTLSVLNGERFQSQREFDVLLGFLLEEIDGEAEKRIQHKYWRYLQEKEVPVGWVTPLELEKLMEQVKQSVERFVDVKNGLR